MKKAYKKEVQQILVAKATQQNQALATKTEISTKDIGTKSTKVVKNPFRRQPADGNKTAQAKVQAISVSYIAQFETDSESEQESDQEQLDIDILLNIESGNQWLDSPQQVYSFTISNFPTAAHFSIEIQGFKTKSWFDTVAQVSCISYDCYKEFKLKK